MHAKNLYLMLCTLKCATADALPAKKSDPENITPDELSKVLAPL